MIKNWNNVVGADDIVYHLGDFAFSSKETLEKIRWRLNGRIRLIMGNHDYHHSYQFYQDLKFDRVYDKPIIWHDFFIMSHEPIFLAVDNGQVQTVTAGKNNFKNSGLMHCINIHGHIHQLKYDDIHYFNACVECNEYKPVNLLELEDHYLSINY
jgi:calcineurin-like phosphoesterase family protein